MVSTGGDVKCFDTVSLSQKLSLHRHALWPITLPRDADVEKPTPVLLLPSPDKADEFDDDGPGLTGKDSRDSSFTFQNIVLPDSWL
jgi:hypothetical protein